jgi:hypothetical protein
MLHWNYKTGLTLAGVLHQPTLASEVRSISTAAWRAHEQLLRGARMSNCCVDRSLMMNSNGCDRRDSFRNEVKPRRPDETDSSTRLASLRSRRVVASFTACLADSSLGRNSVSMAFRRCSMSGVGSTMWGTRPLFLTRR